ncbi:480_t:CDS:2 [Gigaspora margarita]|uniref:480_t:CDS:1 n=1 Tax=Gigaspora margarita TaxID=4874 RepID=A0ABN7UWE1_GIGMA|nr:480_t:CDS:2 [Gigaspora margarita]
MVKKSFHIKLYTEGQHMPTNVSKHHKSAVTHLNLTKEIKLKLLTLFNSISREQLEQQEKYRINSCSEQKIQQLLE